MALPGSGRLKRWMRTTIGSRRRSAAIRGLHSAASFIEGAYLNEGSDLTSNGERALLKRLAPAGFRVAFDVGANNGDWSSETLAVWPDCQVHAFEVAPESCRAFSERFHAGEAGSRVALNGCGLSDLAGTETMYYFPEHPELTCDLPRHEAYKSTRFEAHLTTGDAYCGLCGIETVDFLKIDVEGAEHRVLRGFAEHLTAQKIQCVQFEYGAFSTQTRFLLADYFELLAPSHWVGKVFPTYVEFRDYHWTMEDFRFSNYCCVSRARPDLRRLAET